MCQSYGRGTQSLDVQYDVEYGALLPDSSGCLSVQI